MKFFFPVNLRARLLLLVFLASLPLIALIASRDLETRNTITANTTQEVTHAVNLAQRQNIILISAQQLLMAAAITSAASNKDTCADYYSKFLEKNTIFRNFGYVSSDGYFICSTLPIRTNVKITNLPFFKKAVESQEFTTNISLTGLSTKDPMLFFSYPHFSTTGELKGIFFVTANFSWLDNLIESFEMPVGTKSLVIAGDGTVLASYPPAPLDIGKNLNNSEMMQKIAEHGFNGDAEIEFYDAIGRITAFAPLIMEHGVPRAFILVGIPISAAFAEADNIIQRDILVMLLAGVLIFLIGWVSGDRLILRRLNKLVSAAEKFSRGDFSVRVSDKIQDEIGRLNASFNRMAAQLQSLYANLEGKVKARTKQLLKKYDELEIQKNMLSTLLDNLPQAVVVIKSPKGESLFVNKMAQNLLGPSAKKNIADFPFFEDENDKAYPLKERPFYKSLKSQKTVLKQTGIYLKDSNGERKALRISSAPVFDVHGALTNVVVVIENMTRELAVDRAKSEFVSLASHQLRTPLTATNWFCEMLLSGDAGKLTMMQKDFLEQLYSSNKRLVDLVNSLLNVSRIESGKFSVEPEKVNFTSLVSEILSEYKRVVDKKKLTVTADYDSVTDYIGDRGILRMLLENYISNAIKFTPAKGWVNIALSYTDHELQISVSDSGYGIPAKEQDKVFTKLFRGENIRKYETEGSGLGLYMIKSLVEHFGGRVWFTSEENKGSAFYATLPAMGMERRPYKETLV
ncbi:HAMP domain-containing protein, partial [Patescibacteria group bacterium]|nr:HAMP domain-containing protein [Patescibacteria group bacterium]